MILDIENLEVPDVMDDLEDLSNETLRILISVANASLRILDSLRLSEQGMDPDFVFDMGHFMKPDDSSREGRYYQSDDCGTPSCLLGHALSYYRDEFPTAESDTNDLCDAGEVFPAFSHSWTCSIAPYAGWRAADLFRSSFRSRLSSDPIACAARTLYVLERVVGRVTPHTVTAADLPDITVPDRSQDTRALMGDALRRWIRLFEKTLAENPE